MKDDSNGIQKRQNEEKSICMLAAQRSLYNKAKNFNTISFIISIILPLFLSFFLVRLGNDEKLRITLYIIVILSMFLNLYLSSETKNIKKLAAFIQQKFDIYVYDMKWDKHLFGKNKNVDDDIVEYSNKIINTPAERESLTNWYVSSVDNKPLNKAILICQRENFSWDCGLRKRAKYFYTILILVLIFIVFIIGIINNEVVNKLLERIVFIIPMLRWLFTICQDLTNDITRLKDIDVKINSNNDKNIEDLKEIQRDIFEHRKNCYTIPNWLYKFFKNNEEDKQHRLANMK